MEDRAVAHERGRDPHGRTEPLVRVRDGRVGQLKAVVQRCDAFVEDARQAVGAVHMEPCPVFAGELTRGP